MNILLMLDSQGHTLLSRISGADAAALTSAVAHHTRPNAAAPLSHTDRAPAPAPAEETLDQLNERLRNLMNRNKVRVDLTHILYLYSTDVLGRLCCS